VPVSKLTSEVMVTDDGSTEAADVVQVGFAPGYSEPLGDSPRPEDVNVNLSHAPSKYSSRGQVSSIQIIVFTMSARAFILVRAVPVCMWVPYGPPSSQIKDQCHSSLPVHHHTSALAFRSSMRTVDTYLFPDPVIIDS